jgi:hypothetical protein
MSKSLVTRRQTDSLHSMAQAKGVLCAAFQWWLDTRASSTLDQLIVGYLIRGISAPSDCRMHALTIWEGGVEHTYIMLNYLKYRTDCLKLADAWAETHNLMKTDCVSVLNIQSSHPQLNRYIGDMRMNLVSTQPGRGRRFSEPFVGWWDGDWKEAGPESEWRARPGIPTVWFLYRR